jgi:Flp pilus assembly protein TadG
MSRRRQIPTIFSRGIHVSGEVTVQGRRDERGAAAVEFALILPLLLMFVFGIVEFGRAYNARIELTAAVREGARAAALADPAAPAATTDTATKTATINGAPGLKPALIASQVAVTACPVNPGASTNAEVTATYPFSYDIPFLGPRSISLTAKGVFRCGG